MKSGGWSDAVRFEENAGAHMEVQQVVAAPNATE
jgi:hypothetical protein